MSRRSIVVDDDDSGITYTGSWFRDQGTYNTLGNFGAPFLNTLHGTNSSGSLSYKFVGSQVSVTTTLQFANPTGLSVQCLVDNAKIAVIPNNDPENNLQLCTQDGLSDGPHILTVIANVTNQETFWFDYLSYVPSSSVSLDNATLSIDSTDSQVQLGFGTGWTSFFPGYETRQTGSQFHFNFTGVSLIWYSFYDPSLPWDTSLNTATYSVDGGTPITFNTVVNAPSVTTKPTGVAYNQVLFETADYAAGSHTLEVLYQGSNATTPLTFQFIVVRATPSTSTSASSGISSAISTVSNSASSTTATHAATQLSSNGHKSSNTGAIMGAVIGGLGLLALIAGLILCLRRRRRAQQNEEAASSRRRTLDMYQPLANPVALISEISLNTSTGQIPTTTGSILSNSPPFVNTNPSAYSAPTFSPNTAQSRPYELQLHPGGLTVVNPSDVKSPTDSIIVSPPAVPRKGGILNGRLPPRVIQDEDSGIRLNSSHEATGPIETLPPVYTAG